MGTDLPPLATPMGAFVRVWKMVAIWRCRLHELGERIRVGRRRGQYAVRVTPVNAETSRPGARAPGRWGCRRRGRSPRPGGGPASSSSRPGEGLWGGPGCRGGLRARCCRVGDQADEAGGVRAVLALAAQDQPEIARLE